MTVLKLEDIRIMEDIMIILSFITTPLNLFLLEERLKLIIIFGKRQDGWEKGLLLPRQDRAFSTLEFQEYKFKKYLRQ